MKLSSFILLLIGCTSVFGQSKRFKQWMDTAQVHQNSYLDQYDYKTFFNLSEIQNEMDLTNLNQELLDACLFFVINKTRKKLHRSQLTHSQELYKTANVYTNYYHSSSFEGDNRDNQTVNKVVNYFAAKNDFECSQIKTTVTSCRLMNVKNLQKYHYDRRKVKEDESEYGIYTGSIKKMNDSTYVKEEIKPMTYIQFAEHISKSYFRKQTRTLRSKSWSMASCSVVLDTKSIHRNKLPTAKIVFILAGQRMALIPEEKD